MGIDVRLGSEADISVFLRVNFDSEPRITIGAPLAYYVHNIEYGNHAETGVHCSVKGARTLPKSKNTTRRVAIIRTPDRNQDVALNFHSKLRAKYGVVFAEPVPDDLVELIERLRLLRKSGGRFTR